MENICGICNVQHDYYVQLYCKLSISQKPNEKGKYQSTDNTKIGKERGNSTEKIKRVNVCKYTVKIVLCLKYRIN